EPQRKMSAEASIPIRSGSGQPSKGDGIMCTMLKRAALGLAVVGLSVLASAPAVDAAVFYGGYARARVGGPAVMPVGGVVHGGAAAVRTTPYRGYPGGAAVVHGSATAVHPTPYRPLVGPQVFHASGTAVRS